VQAVHAAIEAARAGLIPPDGQHPHVVVCEVGSIDSLLRAADRLSRSNIRHRLFFDPDLGCAPTALATEPMRGSLRALFRRFPLLKE
jgi:hypothetical protein